MLLVVSKPVAAQYVSKVWVADNGDGTYKNPIIHADYSDPDAIRVGDNFYMIASSFNHAPGLPILQSKDLVNWKIIGHALQKQIPEDRFSQVQHGNGVWAPAIRFHHNEFYIYYPDPDVGIYFIKAKNITGPWSNPVLVESGKGLIDPCPLWDDDGKVYLVHAYAGSRAGIKSILVVKEMNKEGNKIIGNPVMVYDGHQKDPTIEGPKFYKRNGYYYIFAPAGGVSAGWQLALRSKNIYGPYERRVVMEQGHTEINGPHQGAWVTTSTGEDWFLHFQDKDAYGRVVHLQPMRWVNDWPVIGEDLDGDGKGEPVLNFKKPDVGKTYPIETPADDDEFNSPQIGWQWQWQANPKDGWAYATASGMLRMFSVYQPDAVKSIWNTPSILTQKLPAEEFTVKLKVVFKPKYIRERVGLVMLGTDYAYLSLTKNEDSIYFSCKENKAADANGIEKDIADFVSKTDTAYLGLTMERGGKYHFMFSNDGKKYTIIEQEFFAKPGKWAGAQVGMFCLRNNSTNDAGFADIDWIHFEK